MNVSRPAGDGHALARSRGTALAQPPAIEGSPAGPHSPAPLALGAAEVRSLAATPPATALRRLLFVWFRVFVYEVKAGGEVERVNVRLPLPIPLVGALLRRGMSGRDAMRALAAAESSGEGYAALDRHLDAHMGLPLIRVEQGNPGRGRYELVVVGLD